MNRSIILIFLVLSCAPPILTSQIPQTVPEGKILYTYSLSVYYPISIHLNDKLLSDTLDYFTLLVPSFSIRYGFGDSEDVGFSATSHGIFSFDLKSKFLNDSNYHGSMVLGVGFLPFSFVGLSILSPYIGFSLGNNKFYYGIRGNLLMYEEEVWRIGEGVVARHSGLFPIFTVFSGLLMGKSNKKFTPEINLMFPIFDDNTKLEYFRTSTITSSIISFGFLYYPK